MRKTYITDENAGLLTIRDPMITVVNDTYYLTGTQPPYWGGINDGMHLWSTKDLKNFSYHGIIVKREDMPEDMWCRDRFWAPELFFDGEKFLATFSCRNESEEFPHEFGVGLAVSKKAEGPYEIVTKEEPLCSGIDGTIFKDDDGALYIGANGVDESKDRMALLLRKLDAKNYKATDPYVVTTTGEKDEWDFVGVEGQCIVKRSGMYFQWYSSWSDSYYAAGLLTSKSINGPWEKSPQNPIIKENEEYFKCGHNHSFRGLDGKDYIIFHAFCRFDAEEDRCERLYIKEIEYKTDGTVEIK